MYFLDKRYVLMRALTTWNTAKLNCIAQGARLMEIHTHEEFRKTGQLLQEIEQSFVWLGGSDLQEEGNWVWDSNQESINRMEFWYPGRPYDHNENHNCLGFYSTAMTDSVGCTYTRFSICEYI